VKKKYESNFVILKCTTVQPEPGEDEEMHGEKRNMDWFLFFRNEKRGK